MVFSFFAIFTIEHHPIRSNEWSVYALWFLALLFVNIWTEIRIWLPAAKQKYLAQHGVPVAATIESRDVTQDNKGEKYSAQITYYYSGRKHTRKISLSKADCDSLKPGTTEIILCHPDDPNNVVICRLCLYQPILPEASSS